MRIAYCTNLRLPNERAHGLQVAAVVRALATLGHTIDIFHPFRRSPIAADPWSYHELPRSSVHIHTLGSLDPIKRLWAPGVLGLFLLNTLFSRVLKRALLQRATHLDLLYTRTPALLPVLLSIGVPVVIELHSIPRMLRWRFIRHIKRCRLIVALTEPMRHALVNLGVDGGKIIVAPDGVDLARFTEAVDVQKIYSKYALSSSVPLIGYVGQLTSMGLSKGIPELIAAARELTKSLPAFTLLIAGGPSMAAEKLRRSLDSSLLPHIRVVGQLPANAVPALLQTCDVLVYPAPASRHPFYMRDTSPLKIFEYMAAGKPIVAADLPPLKGILDSTRALLVPPGDPVALAQGIAEVLSSPTEAQARAHQAHLHVQQYAWDARMQRILAAARLS